jgi:hypothetical protein
LEDYDLSGHFAEIKEWYNYCCLRISKESIFTGLNNFAVNSVVDVEHDEQFGFTDTEVHQILDDYKLNQHFSKQYQRYLRLR